jgi:hypothetical protein
MNLPLAATQARVAEQAMQQSVAAARCARETAQREAERAKRDAERMQEQISRQTRITASSPLSIDLKGLDGLDRRIQIRTAAIAQQIAVQNAKMQIAAARLQAVSMQMQNAGQRRSPCRGRAEVR